MSESIETTIGVALVGAVIIAVIGLLICSLVWIYRDAEARGKSGWVVALFALFFKWPVSLLLWVIFRPQISAGALQETAHHS